MGWSLLQLGSSWSGLRSRREEAKKEQQGEGRHSNAHKPRTHHPSPGTNPPLQTHSTVNTHTSIPTASPRIVSSSPNQLRRAGEAFVFFPSSVGASSHQRHALARPSAGTHCGEQQHARHIYGERPIEWKWRLLLGLSIHGRRLWAARACLSAWPPSFPCASTQ